MCNTFDSFSLKIYFYQLKHKQIGAVLTFYKVKAKEIFTDAEDFFERKVLRSMFLELFNKTAKKKFIVFYLSIIWILEFFCHMITLEMRLDCLCFFTCGKVWGIE